MADFIYWPRDLLVPFQILPAKVPFTRGGGRSLGGLERVTRTDKGFWKITYEKIVIHSRAQRRSYRAIDTDLGGRAGLLVLPIHSRDTAPYASGSYEPRVLVPHDDGTPFDDGSLYEQGAIDIRMGPSSAQIGQTTMTLRLVHGEPDLSGVRFSYNHALYETGRALSVVGDLWTVTVFPSVRAPIPAGAELEFDDPTCLVRLESDRSMDMPHNAAEIVEVSLGFDEAHEYWADLAEELA